MKANHLQLVALIALAAPLILMWNLRDGPADAPPIPVVERRPVPAGTAGREQQSIATPRPLRSTAVAGLVSEIQERLHSTNPNDREYILNTLLAELVRLDAQAAVRFIDTNITQEDRDQYVLRLAQDWAAWEPSEALKWALEQASESDRDLALATVCLKIAEKNPIEALQIAQDHQLAGEGIIESLASQWATRDFASALHWVQSQSLGPERDQLMERMAFVQAQVAPQDAALLVVNEIPPGPIRTEAAIAIVRQWALRDLSGATEWVQRFPEGPLRTRAAQELNGIIATQAKN